MIHERIVHGLTMKWDDSPVNHFGCHCVTVTNAADEIVAKFHGPLGDNDVLLEIVQYAEDMIVSGSIPQWVI